MPTCSFSEALKFKYGEDLGSDPSDPCEIFVVGSFPGRSSPSGRLVLPKLLTLNCCEIDRAGAQQTIQELCHSVEELDLAQNELDDLCEIDKIVCHMPNLNFLNLSHNSMKNSSPEDMSRAENIRSLVLNHTYAPWSVVNCFLEAMPNIQELHLSLNDYSSVDIAPNNQYKSLRQLFICGNPLSSWDDVLLLDKVFPHLEALIMADTHISNVPDPQLFETVFQNLQSLNFNNALIKDWTDIDRLNSFHKLEDVRLQGIPVLEELNELERRQHLIAYLPCVTRLNGSDITPKEREDSERAFIRHYLSKNNRPKRFYDLEEIHGKLDPLVDVDLSPKKTAQMDIHFCEEQFPLTINLQQTVQDLKTMLSARFGLRPAKIRVFYVDQDMKGYCGPDELRFNSRKLYTYNIRDGDEFLVDTK